MKKIFIINLLFFILINNGRAQDQGIYDLFLKFEKFYSQGDMLNAEKCMKLVLNSKDSVSDRYQISMYINLGVISNLLGRNKESIEYFNNAESLVQPDQESQKILADIYLNKAWTYNLWKMYSYSIDFLEKAIRIYQSELIPDKTLLFKISVAYQDLAISYHGIRDFKKALEFLQKSLDLKTNFDLPEKALIYLNIANVYTEIQEFDKAEKFYLMSIKQFIEESGEKYYRIADVYFDYSNLLRANGRESEALKYQNKALSLGQENFGEKHPYVSLAYRYIGDHFAIQSKSDSALHFYQKALISQVRGFDNLNINQNPSIDSALLDLDLLKILQKKCEELEKFSIRQNNLELKQQVLSKSLETIELCVQLINKIRHGYISEDSHLYLMENEKETFIHASHINQSLFGLTSDPSYLKNMYKIAGQAKSSILHNEIIDNEMLYSIGLSDTLIQKHNVLREDIASYYKLLYDELKTVHPDNIKIDIWKDALFDMNREKEDLENAINIRYPQYQNLLHKTDPINLEEIQNQLKSDETLIEYLFSNKYVDGRRRLYIFTITKSSLNFKEEFIDSAFVNNVEVIRNYLKQLPFTGDPFTSYKKFSSALYNMYTCLIMPVENQISGNKLIIIPDEEISFLPFDAFITNQPDPNQINYEGLQYLIKQFSISYNYSSSLMMNKSGKKNQNHKIYAFSPDYLNTTDNIDTGNYFLTGTRKEIREIFKYFKGHEFIGNQATEHNFRSAMHYPAIFHLAMHNLSDTTNSSFSRLVFYSQSDTIEDGFLYDYEISLCRISSPMVVLSACNTGTGMLYRGEGVMSITRAFILAGASSVIKTLWDVNDDASAKIVSTFYKNLSYGIEKDEALRLAKLEYMKNSSPGYSNPYYWAAFQVIGDNSPIKQNNKTILFLCLMTGLAAGNGIVFFYYKRRRSFLA